MHNSSSGRTQRKRHVPRVDQVDAQALDDEVFAIWKNQLTLVFKYFKPTLLDQIEPELNALLRLLVWKISLKTFHATVGQQLLLIKYRDAPVPLQRKLNLYALLIVLCHWLKDRSDTVSIIVRKRNLNVPWLPKLLDWGEMAIKSASFVNFFIFLYEGKYLTFVERILKLRKVPSTNHGFRQLEYDYMARELLWHGFAEFTTFLLPYVSWKVLWNRSRFTKQKPEQLQPANPRCCSICKAPFCRPHVIGCEHVFCYYCIMHKFTADNDCHCPVCGYESSIGSIEPLQVM